MDAIIAAGGAIARDDPLYPYTGGKPKSLLRIGERTMLERVVHALKGSHYVDDVVIAGLDEANVQGLDLCEPLAIIGEQGGVVRNLHVAVEWLRARRPDGEVLLLSTADIPLLSSGVVDGFIDDCRPFDCLAYYNLVTRQTMERRFPHSGRTFVKLKGVEVAGGDLMLCQTRIVDTNEALWNALVDGRKQAWKLARIVGLWTVLKLITRQLTFSEVEELGSRMMGAPVRVLNSPYAELAMDVDKPSQLELLQRELFSA